MVLMLIPAVALGWKYWEQQQQLQRQHEQRIIDRASEKDRACIDHDPHDEPGDASAEKNQREEDDHDASTAVMSSSSSSFGDDDTDDEKRPLDDLGRSQNRTQVIVSSPCHHASHGSADCCHQPVHTDRDEYRVFGFNAVSFPNVLQEHWQKYWQEREIQEERRQQALAVMMAANSSRTSRDLSERVLPLPKISYK